MSVFTPPLSWNISGWSIEQKVAQCLMVGFEGTFASPDETSYLTELLQLGLGGIITFRRNYQGFQPGEAGQVTAMHQRLQASLPKTAPPLWIGIDQEGGQIERLPFWLFPTSLSPLAIGHANNPAKTATLNYQQMAQHLALLGINFNFVPTLDLNLNPNNPIIGVRAFGDNPELTHQLGQIAINQHLEHNVLPIIKHFPGHGNGSVDSHLDLPELVWTETESEVFHRAIQANAPVVLVSHGYYPALQTEEGFGPATASQAVIQTLLRQQYGFDGVVISDDMTMGAVTKHFKSQEDAAIACLSAGVDMLVYQTADESVSKVFNAIVQAYQSGLLKESDLDASVQRILAAKATHGLSSHSTQNIDTRRIQEAFAPKRLEEKSLELAKQGVTWLSTPKTSLKQSDRLLVIAPDRNAIHHYQGDLEHTPDLKAAFTNAGFEHVTLVTYTPKAADQVRLNEDESYEAVLWLTWNPNLDSSQAVLSQAIEIHFPQTPLWLVSIGMHDLPEGMQATAHLGLWSFRPVTIQAMMNHLLNSFDPDQSLLSSS